MAKIIIRHNPQQLTDIDFEGSQPDAQMLTLNPRKHSCKYVDMCVCMCV